MTKKKKGFINKLFGFETIKQGASITKSMINDARPSKKEMVKESFHKALKRLGVTKSEENQKLLMVYRNNKIQFYIIFFGMSFLLYNSINGFIVNGDSFSGMLSSFSFLTISVALFTVSLHYGFRTFQIRKKRLGMLKEWLSSPKEWYPKKITKEYLEKVDVFQQNNPDHLRLGNKDYLEKMEKFFL